MKKLYVILILILFTLQYANSQWVLQNSNTLDNIVDVVMLDSVIAIAIGDRNAVLRTTDAGNTWINQTIMLSATFNWNAISFSSRFDGVIVGDHTIWITTDGGISWNPRNAIPNQKMLSVLQLYLPHIMVGTDSGFIYTSLDTGSTWTSEKISNWEICSIFTWRGPFVRIGLSIFALTPHSFCYSYLYPTNNWYEDTLDAFDGLGSEAFDGEYCNGGGSGFIVGMQGDWRAAMTILRNNSVSSKSWLPVPVFSEPDGELYGVSAPSFYVAYVCGSGGSIFKSVDSGYSWIQMSTPTERNLRAIYFFDESHGMAVGDSGTILYTSNDDVTDVNDNSRASSYQFRLYQNYPNPFNPTTTIKYEIPAFRHSEGQSESNRPSEVYVSLKVYDLLGREVATLVNQQQTAGSYSVKFDGSNLASGVYFCRIQSENFIDAKKLILLR